MRVPAGTVTVVAADGVFWAKVGVAMSKAKNKARNSLSFANGKRIEVKRIERWFAVIVHLQ